ncbi:MAG TPA: ATP-binding protein, partial [Ignavibacteriaceae bacterium]
NGNIWAGTYSQGLYKFDPNTKKIQNWKYNSSNHKGISNNYITSILQDNDGYIWISTYNGLNKFNPDKISEGFEVFFNNSSDKNSLSNNLVWKLTQSQFNRNLIWIGTAGGLCSYNLKKGYFERLNIKAAVPSQFSNSFATVAEQTIFGKSILWAATYGGLFRIDLTDNTSVQYVSDVNKSTSLVGNQIDDVMIDKSGVLWIATDKGLNFHSLKSHNFNNIFSKKADELIFKELLNSDVKSIVKNVDDNFYIASSEALFVLKIKNGQTELKKINAFNDLNLWSIEKGSNNDLWIGSYGKGLIHYNLINSEFKYIKIESPTFITSAFNYIKSLHLSKNGILWIGFWGGGLARYDTKTDKYKLWINNNSDDASLSFNDVWDIFEDKSGRLWIGTNGGGLNLFTPNDGGIFKHWVYEEGNNNSIVNNSIHSIYELPSNDKSETVLLVGTENGLSKVTVTNKNDDKYDVTLKFENFNNIEKLSNRPISGVMADKNGVYWISTNSGLVRFNPILMSTVNFRYSDGFKSNLFNPGAFCMSDSGMMIFGTSKGPVVFNPSEIILSKFNPKIIITDFQLFNESVIPGENSPLKNSVEITKEIDLDYNQNVFTVKFASLDYNASEQIQFLYKLEGFDKDWIRSGSHRSVTYTNIDPGTYTLRVKGTNSDGNWSDQEAKLIINISPPIWKTIWAYALYVSIIAFVLFTIRKFEVSRTKLRNELRHKELEAKNIREIENMKSRFFANLSHEFRTPLMLIKGPAEQLITNKEADKEVNYNLIYRNSEKLQTLIDQLLELSQLESSAIPLNAVKKNIIASLRGLFFSFKSYADEKGIKLTFTATQESIYVWFDDDKLDKIINNLLSNAFKFTPKGGTISLTITTIENSTPKFLQINLTDSGIGIPKDKIPKIFDRFFQVDDSSKRAYGGSGIGLALVRELIDLHKWKIKVNSEMGSGSEFTIEIPLDDDYLNENEKVIKIDASDINNKSIEKIINNHVEETSNKKAHTVNKSKIVQSDKNESLKSVMIVEDSEDVRTYLSELLKNNYKILLAENGLKGLDTALEFLPDLIISDVMMPEIDGIEFCKRIKSDWRTSHIPVVLLTAKASIENKIEGLDTGADDYITKPFSSRELSVRIKNILAQRILLREKFGKGSRIKPENFTPNKADQEFIVNAINIVEKYISDPEFDSEKFAKEIFLSRSQLHRKILNISGQSTGEFIRTIRLKKAAALLLEKKLSVTQIAFEIGFSSPSHFTKAFKQMFDCLPSEYLNNSNS